MVQEEIEKTAFCPVCLENLTTKLHFASDDYLYQKNCFTNIFFKSPISGQGFSYYLPVYKVVNDKLYFEKNIKNNFRIPYELNGFDDLMKMDLTKKELMNMDMIEIKDWHVRKNLNKQ